MSGLPEAAKNEMNVRAVDLRLKHSEKHRGREAAQLLEQRERGSNSGYTYS